MLKVKIGIVIETKDGSFIYSFFARIKTVNFINMNPVRNINLNGERQVIKIKSQLIINHFYVV